MTWFYKWCGRKFGHWFYLGPTRYSKSCQDAQKVYDDIV